MLYLNCVLTILVALAIDKTYSVLAENGKFDTTLKPSTLTSLPNERRAINFKENSEESTDHQRSENESDTTEDSKQEKKIRTLNGPLTSEGGDKFPNHQCCGSRYEVGSPGRQEASPKDSSRYSSHYGSRPEDRFGWHSYTPSGSSGRRGGSGSSSGSSGGLYGSHLGGDRYGGSKPSYYGDNEYERPGGNGGRPGRPNYGYGSHYGDNGAYGSSGYEVSRPGGHGGGRPPGGINFGGGRPGSGSYGGGSYGGGGYGGGGHGGGGHGIYGTISEEDEFPDQNGEGEDGGPPHPPGVNNLQTQKAVALKALAGVALIGAAAALATNPVLLPIGVLAGRRRRSLSLSSPSEDVDVDELIKLLQDHIPKIYREKIEKAMLTSPTCVARLACEIQRELLAEQIKNSTDVKKQEDLYRSMKRQLANLLQSKVLHPDIHYKNIKKLIASAEAYNGNCNVFVCGVMKE